MLRRVTVAVVAGVLAAGAAALPGRSVEAAGAWPAPNGVLAPAVLDAVRTAGFDTLDDVADLGPVVDGCPAPSCPVPLPSIGATPNVEITVLQLDGAGSVVDSAEVLVSRDVPRGMTVGITPSVNLRTVTFRKWNAARWDGPYGWTDSPPIGPSEVLVASGAPKADFMSPFPDTMLRLPVAMEVLRMVDAGAIALSDPVAYTVRGVPLGTRSLLDWLSAMVSSDDTLATKAMVKLLHDAGRIDDLRTWLDSLGLTGIRVDGTSPVDGGTWLPGQISMTSFDTARLLLLVTPGSGRLWRGPNGSVSRSELSSTSRRLLRELLDQQAWHNVASTAAVCGAPGRVDGIPAAEPATWVQPDGSVMINGTLLSADVRACQAAATVTFSHLAAGSWNSAADAGIVDNLPGRTDRHYVVAITSNLGHRFIDRRYAGRVVNPCYTIEICVTQKVPAMAGAIDAAIAALPTLP